MSLLGGVRRSFSTKVSGKPFSIYRGNFSFQIDDQIGGYTWRDLVRVVKAAAGTYAKLAEVLAQLSKVERVDHAAVMAISNVVYAKVLVSLEMKLRSAINVTGAAGGPVAAVVGNRSLAKNTTEHRSIVACAMLAVLNTVMNVRGRAF